MNNSSDFPTLYWQPLKDGRIQCDLCPRLCKLHEGQRGLCFVRARRNDKIVLTSWGRSSGFCIDPIEKKPLNHFFPGTPVLSFGTAGCNLSCKFCQNWDMSKSREMDRLQDTADPELIAEAAHRHHCRSVAYTYNDPVIFLEYAVDTAKACRKRGLKSVAVTAGYIQKAARREFFAAMDATNIDLKSFSEKFYRNLAGGHLQPVLDTLEYVKHETSVWLEITTLLIPEKNDSASEIRELTKWIKDNLGDDVPLHFTAFHPDWKMMNSPPTPPETLKKARLIALESGLKHVYTGNISDPQGNSTYCASCGELLISRNGYVITGWQLKDNRCPACGQLCAGHFENAPGDWGARRQPITLSA